MYEWDEGKSLACLEKRGFDFSIVENFDWESAVVIEDARRDYGERRFRAFGWIDDRIFALAFTPRDGKIRIISMRQMHEKEGRRYGL